MGQLREQLPIFFSITVKFTVSPLHKDQCTFYFFSTKNCAAKEAKSGRHWVNKSNIVLYQQLGNFEYMDLLLDIKYWNKYTL
jgi:hypothetical protein